MNYHHLNITKLKKNHTGGCFHGMVYRKRCHSLTISLQHIFDVPFYIFGENFVIEFCDELCN